MTVKIGNSYVSESAYTYVKNSAQNNDSIKNASEMLSHLASKFPDMKFSTATGKAAMGGTGTNNIAIAPNILREMAENPEKRIEYEALIYDFQEVMKNAPSTIHGSKVIAAGSFINEDGSVGGWSMTQNYGEDTQNHLSSLNKKDKKSWISQLFPEKKEVSLFEKLQKNNDKAAIQTYKEAQVVTEKVKEGYTELTDDSLYVPDLEAKNILGINKKV